MLSRVQVEARVLAVLDAVKHGERVAEGLLAFNESKGAKPFIDLDMVRGGAKCTVS
jgi:hypothetical protein